MFDVAKTLKKYDVFIIFCHSFFMGGSVSTKADNCPHKRVFIVGPFLYYQHLCLCTLILSC